MSQLFEAKLKVKVKVKVKVTLEEAMKAQTGSRDWLCSFFNPSARCGGWAKTRTSHFTPGERRGTPCTGGWVGLRTGLDECGNYRPHRDSISGPSRP